ncbi:MAG: HAD family hydrolase [Solirubrobacterales bacterium]|nr:HAD family hydrolase [Solirubrobacterales bacterium]
MFDLDGTLVEINQRILARGLLLAGARRFATVVPPWRFRSTYGSALAAARANTTDRTNHEVFLLHLMERTCRPERIQFLMKEFAAGDLGRLQTAFTPVPGARETLAAARALGYELVLATNPLWPLAAVRLRLRRAGLEDIRFRFISHSEVSTRCKPSADYYRELMHHSRVSASECVMIGNDPDRDAAATQLGIKTFLLAQDGRRQVTSAGNDPILAIGTLPDLLEWLVACRLARAPGVVN